MELTKIGTKPSIKGPEDWFTGPVRIDPLFDPNNSRRAAAATVTLRTRCQDCLAHTSPWTNANYFIWSRMGSKKRRSY